MIKNYSKLICYFILGIIPLIVFQFDILGGLPIFNEPVILIATYLVFIILAATFIMSLKLNQLNGAIISLLVGVLYYYSLNPPNIYRINLNPIRYFELITLALPISISAIYLFKESKILSTKTILKTLTTIIPFVFFIVWISDFNNSYIKVAYYHFIKQLNVIEVPQVAFLSILFAICVSIYKRNSNQISFIMASIFGLLPL